MPLVPKLWKNEPDPLGPPVDLATDTPLDADGLNDLEARHAQNAERLTGGKIITPEDFTPSAGSGSDDADAFLGCMDQIIAWGGGTIKLGAKTYLINGGALDQSHRGNAVIPLPDATLPDPEITGGVVEHPWIHFEGSRIGLSTIRTTRTGDDYDPVAGPPSLIGGPTREGQDPGGLPVTKTPTQLAVSWRGIDILHPDDSDICMLDFQALSHAQVSDSYFAPATRTKEGAVQPTNKYQYGLRMPRDLNSGRVEISNCRFRGSYANIVMGTTHMNLRNVSSHFAKIAYALDQQYPENGDAHLMVGNYVQSDHNQYHLAAWDPINGVLTGPPVGALTTHFLWIQGFDIEDGEAEYWHATIDHIRDVNNQLFGQIDYQKSLGGVGIQPGPLDVTGCMNLRMRDIASGMMLSRPVSSRLATVSAGQLVLPTTLPSPGIVLYNDATNITGGISTDGQPDQMLIIRFASTPTVSDSANLKLNGAFTAAGTTNDQDTLTLMSTGANWYEIARSPN